MRRVGAAGTEARCSSMGCGRRDSPLPGLSAAGSRGGGEQWTAGQSECEPPTLPTGRAGQEKEQAPDPRKSAAAEKFRVFGIGREGKGATECQLSNTFGNSHRKTSWTDWTLSPQSLAAAALPPAVSPPKLK